MNDYHKSSLEYLSIEHSFCGWNLTFLLLWSEFKEAESIDSSWPPIIVLYVSIIIIVIVQELFMYFRPLFFSRQNIECLHAFWLGIKVKLFIRQDQANICIDVSRVAKKTCNGQTLSGDLARSLKLDLVTPLNVKRDWAPRRYKQIQQFITKIPLDLLLAVSNGLCI